jgi:hypothetical protein
LALALGMSVARAQREISAREFAEWMAYDRIDPIGRDRDDWRAVFLAAMLANIHRPKNKRPYRLKDFWPRWDTTDPDEEELARKIKAAMGALAAYFDR